MRLPAAGLLVITIVACGGSSGPSGPSGSPAPPASPTPAPLPSPSPTPSPEPSTTPGGALAVSCQANPRSGTAPLQVSFTTFPSGATGSYVFEWAFGDGGSSTNPNPSHVYDAPGRFEAAVRVTSGDETASCAREITVTAAPAPGPTPAPTPTPPPGLATVTITNAGVSPQSVQIARGGTVRFVNQSSGQHQIQSDPHPIHTDCPPINQVPFLSPGQSGQTGAFTVAGTCGYHDHLNPTNGSLQGSIQVIP